MRIEKNFIFTKFIWVLFIGTHLICFSLFSQSRNIDSLQALINASMADTTNVNLLNELGLEYLYEEDFDRAKSVCFRKHSIRRRI